MVSHHYHWPGTVRALEHMVKRMVVLGNEQAVLQEIALYEPPTPEPAENGAFDAQILSGDMANGDGIDLKSISKAEVSAPSGCESSPMGRPSADLRSAGSPAPPSICRTT